MKLYIIRHAQSVNNALADQWQRVSDPDLTELGYKQAEIVADHLANGFDPEYRFGASDEETTLRRRHSYNITHLYCSAMYRALLTAQPIGKALGLAPQVWVDIHEHGGIFLQSGPDQPVTGYPGKNCAEILEQFPGYILPDEVTEEGWWNPKWGKEDWSTCHGRASRVAHHLRQRAESDDNIAVVSHGGFIDVLLKALTFQLPARHIFYHHYNTAITRIDFRPDATIDIRHINRYDHLPPDMLS